MDYWLTVFGFKTSTIGSSYMTTLENNVIGYIKF